MTTAHMHYPTGLEFRPLLEGLERDHCQCPHRGYVIEGRVRVDYEDSSEEAVSPDELYYRPATPSSSPSWSHGLGHPASNGCAHHEDPLIVTTFVRSWGACSSG